MNYSRYLRQFIESDLKSKMVFIGGPRQIGKTTLALSFLQPKNKNSSAYLNWDIIKHQKSIRTLEIPSDHPLIVFDEIHKFSKWKTLLKGFYDAYVPEINCIVTGSARLNVFKKGGDSLLGRYHYFRMHPLSPFEINKNFQMSDLQGLLKFGGFPDPFSRAEERFLRRWQKDRSERLVQEDLRDLGRVKDLTLIEMLMEALPSRVGSPLSIQSLREDLQVAHESVQRWIEILEYLYLVYRIPPFGSPKIRAVKKEQKLYFWDWTSVENSGPRFENFVANQLLRYCHYQEDVEGYKMELRFIRDIDGREIDFVILQDKKPLFAVECKTGENQLSSHISYFKNRTNIPRFYQVHLGKKHFGHPEKEGQMIPIDLFIKEILKL
ncbi:MAG: ATP-binding protein [Deltaproteobacteria bacterium]|jgi:predicted AAA+ superfamily ATPase|nr:ATP-binding protein [Deltaproteobacteria bacterium]